MIVALMIGGPNAFAQDAGDIALARSIGTEGLRLAETGNCEAAVDKLTRAERLFHAPTTLERLGECQVKLGHYVEGTENLRRVARERLGENAPAPFVTAQQHAKEALDAAMQHIAKLRVDVAGPAAGDVVLKIDGEAVSTASIGAERPIDPGKHTIEASAPGFKPTQTSVTIPDAGAKAIALKLERDLTVKIVPHEEPRPESHSVRVLWPAGIALGIGGAGLILGGVWGGVAIGKKNDLVAACGGTSCPPAQHGAFDDLSTFATLSTVGFIVGGVAAAAGVVLFFVAPRKTVVESVALHASLGGATLVGTF